jgi:hypothetical protein
MAQDLIWQTFANAQNIGAETSKVWNALEGALQSDSGHFKDAQVISQGETWDDNGWVCLSAWCAWRLKLKKSRKRFSLTFCTSFFTPADNGGGWVNAQKAKLITAYTPDANDWWEFGTDLGIDSSGRIEGCKKSKGSNLWIWAQSGVSKDMSENAWVFATELLAIKSLQDIETAVLMPVVRLIDTGRERGAFSNSRGVLG